MESHNLASNRTDLYYQIHDSRSTPQVVKGYDRNQILKEGDLLLINALKLRVDKITRKDHGGTFDNPQDKINACFIAEVSEYKIPD